MILIIIGSAWAESMTREVFAERLERAEKLNVSEPWQESQAVLDELEPHLELGTPEQQAQFLLLKARNQVLAGNMTRGLDTLQSLFRRPMPTAQRARAYALAANTATLLRRWEDTFEYLGQALALREELGPAEWTQVPLSLAAYLYAKIGEIPRAIEYGKQSVTTARAYGTKRDQCTDQGRLAYVYKVDDQFEAARREYEEAIEVCRQSGDELLTGVVESGLADLLRKTGELDRASSLFEQALSRLEEVGYSYGLAEARLYLARLHFTRGDFDRVRELLDLALPVLENDQSWDYVGNAQRMMAEMAAETGDYQAAFSHMRQRSAAREEYLDRERARQVAWLEVEFDTQSREQELALLREQRRVAELESESRRNQTQLRWLLYAFTTLLFVVLILLLVHVLRERRHFRRLAGLDGLTGLDNHTRFFDTARKMVEEAHHSGRPLVHVIGDIDYFKRVNDEFGHIAGDRALREVARVFRESFPRAGAIGRIGGEEMALCLPGQTIERVLPRLEALRAALGRIDYGGNRNPLTMSFGVAQLASGEPLEELRLRTDQALYRAKHSGRNSVVTDDSSKTE